MSDARHLKKYLPGTNQKTKILIMIGIILLLIAAFYGFKAKTTVKGQRAGEMKPAVDVLTVARKDMTREVVLTGQTVPVFQVDIVAKYTGRITGVNVELGQHVSQGQNLIVQDMGDVDISIAQNGASLRQANADAIESQANFEASYQKAQDDYQRAMTSLRRYQTLYEQGAISKEVLDNTEQQVTTARAALETWSKQIAAGNAATVLSKQAASDKAQSTVDALINQKNDLILRAPREGIIGYRQAEVGTMAQAGVKLLSIVDNSHIFVDCAVSEQDIGQITLGMPTVISVDSLGKTYAGKITYISPAMDTKTQTFTIRMDLDHPDDQIKTGMFARTNLTVLLRSKTLFVPKEAVLSMNGISRVFVIDSNSKIIEKTVKLGLVNDTSVEILTGIDEGEQIAVTNLARLKSGIAVTINPISQ
ncbi:efflux RND transporter periplasmic adaptor subunit [Pelosinus sp. sgz500959]|uniref:efflux RND transporter periplasmic adaptor subunit n=1 Tax=Pelosinus sp. sgz500959 TaxID=3242472 RepID=UPI003671CA04